MKVGYARVSTARQNKSLETQRKALEAAGCARVFEDVLSGARAEGRGRGIHFNAEKALANGRKIFGFAIGADPSASRCSTSATR